MKQDGRINATIVSIFLFYVPLFSHRRVCRDEEEMNHRNSLADDVQTDRCTTTSFARVLIRSLVVPDLLYRSSSMLRRSSRANLDSMMHQIRHSIPSPSSHLEIDVVESFPYITLTYQYPCHTMTMMKRSLLLLFTAVVSTVQVHGWATSHAGLSRRDAVATAFGVVTGVGSTVLLAPTLPALAAGSPPSEADITRLKEGYKGLEYLLDNFEQETTICRENGGECKRNADAVRKALGLRSTTDPLFQVEKIFEKVKFMNLDEDKLEPFFEATEDWNSAMNMR
jgi:hypothetical protein